MCPKAHAGGCHLKAIPGTVSSSFSFSPPLLHLTKRRMSPFIWLSHHPWQDLNSSAYLTASVMCTMLF